MAMSIWSDPLANWLSKVGTEASDLGLQMFGLNPNQAATQSPGAPYTGIQAPPLPKAPGVPSNLDSGLSSPDALLTNSWNTYLQDNVNFFNDQGVRNSETTPALASLVSGDILGAITPKSVSNTDWGLLLLLGIAGIVFVKKVL